MEFGLFSREQNEKPQTASEERVTEGNRVISEWHFSVELFGTIDTPTKLLSTERVKRGE
jgi:hypothetical protein